VPAIPAAPVLVVTATRREADAVVRDLGAGRNEHFAGYAPRSAAGVLVAAAGIGMAEAAAATAALVAQLPVSAVFSIGVAGGYDVPMGAVAVGRSVTRADTGVELVDGSTQTTMQAIGMGDSTYQLGDDLVDRVVKRLPGAYLAHVLTVATVTGTAERAARVLARAPDRGPAVEDMEAWGVHAGTPRGVPFLVVKTVSNPLGPRDRDNWDLAGALDALSDACFALFNDPIDWS
jgi:futalosine hydrolase